MNYELVKELGDAGFPLSRVTDKDLPDGEMFISNTPHYTVPTLSELIEACGDGFEDLHRVVSRTLRQTNIYWVANLVKQFCKGDSAEVAVARLWLSLQKNKALPPKQE